ncbi:MAG TPA: ferritin-like domain-containing protein [Abditibacteriaceae bacterium]|jgi:bacterioferritin
MSEEQLMVGDRKIDRVNKEELIELLNGDLSREYQAIITYIQYSASVTGPYRQDLKQFFASEIPDETMHAQYLADKISALGGIPTVTPEPVEQETNAKKMLQNVAEAELAARNNYSTRAKQADELGEVGLANRLEDMADDESGHLDETLKILRGWD